MHKFLLIAIITIQSYVIASDTSDQEPLTDYSQETESSPALETSSSTDDDYENSLLLSVHQEQNHTQRNTIPHIIESITIIDPKNIEILTDFIIWQIKLETDVVHFMNDKEKIYQNMHKIFTLNTRKNFGNQNCTNLIDKQHHLFLNMLHLKENLINNYHLLRRTLCSNNAIIRVKATIVLCLQTCDYFIQCKQYFIEQLDFVSKLPDDQLVRTPFINLCYLLEPEKFMHYAISAKFNKDPIIYKRLIEYQNFLYIAFFHYISLQHINVICQCRSYREIFSSKSLRKIEQFIVDNKLLTNDERQLNNALHSLLFSIKQIKQNDSFLLEAIYEIGSSKSNFFDFYYSGILLSQKAKSKRQKKLKNLWVQVNKKNLHGIIDITQDERNFLSNIDIRNIFTTTRVCDIFCKLRDEFITYCTNAKHTAICDDSAVSNEIKVLDVIYDNDDVVCNGEIIHKDETMAESSRYDGLEKMFITIETRLMQTKLCDYITHTLRKQTSINNLFHLLRSQCNTFKWSKLINIFGKFPNTYTVPHRGASCTFKITTDSQAKTLGHMHIPHPDSSFRKENFIFAQTIFVNLFLFLGFTESNILESHFKIPKHL